MEKKRVSVQIEGRSYSLITTDDEKYVQKVANEVLSHIRKAAQSTKQLDTRDCAVLAALNFCDDRNKALKKNKDYVEKADKIIQQTNDLNRLCKEYREKLTEAMNDNTRLINNNKELEKRLAVLGHEVSQLKEKLQSVEKGKEKAKSEVFLSIADALVSGERIVFTRQVVSSTSLTQPIRPFSVITGSFFSTLSVEPLSRVNE